MIAESYQQRVAHLQQESNHWRQVAAQQQQKLQSLESENNQARTRLQDYERKMSELLRERQSLQSARTMLVEKYQQLRKNALQLDAFRKSIMQMVERQPLAVALGDSDASFIDLANGAAAHVSALSGAGMMMGSFGEETSVDDLFSGNNPVAMQSAAPDSLEQLHLTPFQADTPRMANSNAIGNSNASLNGRQGKAYRSASRLRQSPNKTNNGDTSIDAPTLYRQIRQVLNASEFDQFATQIAHFNAGHQTPEETLRRIESLLSKDTALMGQMRHLVIRAVSESDLQAENHTMTTQSTAELPAS